jgi:uncharacterized protein YuzE
VTACLFQSDRWERTIRIKYDPDADAAYIHLTNVALDPGRDTIEVETPENSTGMVNMDWKDGKLVGIEILNASTLLPEDLLDEA